MKKEDWTGLHFLEKTSYYDNKKEHFSLLWIILLMAAHIGLVLSTFAMLFNTLSFEVDAVFFGGVIAAGTVVMWILSGRKLVFFGAFTVAAAGLAFYIWTQLDSLASGFVSLFNRGDALFSDYLAGLADSGEWSGRLGLEIYMIIALGLVLLCGLFTFGFKKALPAALPGVLCVAGTFIVGKVPHGGWFAVFLMSACVLAAENYAAGRFGRSSALDALGRHFYIRAAVKKIRSIGAKSALLVLGAVILCSGLALFIKNQVWSPDKEWLKDYQQEIRGWYKENVHLLDQEVDKNRGPAKGGVNGGNLGSVGDLYYHGDRQLRVEVDIFPHYNMYIKGYVGDKYENNRWIVDESGEYDSFVRDNGLGDGEQTRIFDMTYYGLEWLGVDRMQIEKLAEFGDYVFMPYGASTGGSNGLRRDLYIQGSGSTSEFSYSPAVYGYMRSYDELMGMYDASASEGSDIAGIEPLYRAYVYEHYTQVPSQTRQMLEQFSALPEFSTINEKVVYVRSQLHNACTYSLTPGSLPAGRDFTEYFLLENKMGYCMHFATAATLMLRSMGVPARYAEGYIVVPGNFKSSGEGIEATIYDHQAHAWTEIYLDGFGWVPVEMTPSYYDETSMNAELNGETLGEGESRQETYETETVGNETAQMDSERQANNESRQSDSKASPELESGGDPAGGNGAGGKNDGESGGKGFFAALPGVLVTLFGVLLIAAAAVALILGLIIFRANMLYKKRLDAMGQPDKSKAVVAIYNSLIKLFECCGYRYSDYGTLHDYFEQVAKEYDCIDLELMDGFIEQVNRAAFSKDGVDEETWKQGRRMYEQIRSQVLNSQTKLKRLLIKYIQGC